MNLGPTELIIIGVVVLLFLGPKKLPEAFRSLGKAMTEFRRARDSLLEPLRQEVDEVLRMKEVDEAKDALKGDVDDGK